MAETSSYGVTRVSLSMPCSVPVLPGTKDANAPIEQRTDKCATEGWWWVGERPICDPHFREFVGMVGDNYAEIVSEFRGLGWEIREDVEATR